MKSSLIKGILFALVSCVTSCIFYFALSPFFADSLRIKLLIIALGVSYIAYLFSQSKERVGRVTVIALWFLLVTALGYFSPSIPLLILIQLIAIWLVRSLYFHSSFISSFTDLILNGLSLVTAFWAFGHTGSVFLTIWCFFLTQALFVLIPSNSDESVTNKSQSQNNEDGFQQAYRVAEAAVKQLSTQS